MKRNRQGLSFGGTSMVRPGCVYRVRPIDRIVVLHDGPNPTLDIYFRKRLSVPGTPPMLFADISDRPDAKIDIAAQGDGAGVFVVVCRYITGEWLTALERNRDRLAGVAYFADDDLAAMLRDRTLPIRYRFRIWRRYGRYVRRLSALAGELWVATPALAEKYQRHGARLLPPLYVPGLKGVTRPLRYCYHGTAAHGPELRWLVDVVAEVQQRNADAVFEVMGGVGVRAMFRDINRVVVVHPMNWPTYLAHSAGTPKDIGLAPLFPSSVNAVRAHTRFFDIARAGAAGIYSNRPPYAGYVRHGEDGLLLGDDRSEWVKAILDLAADPERRSTMARAARLRCRQRDDALLRLLGVHHDSKVMAAGAGREGPA